MDSGYVLRGLAFNKLGLLDPIIVLSQNPLQMGNHFHTFPFDSSNLAVEGMNYKKISDVWEKRNPFVILSRYKLGVPEGYVIEGFAHVACVK